MHNSFKRVLAVFLATLLIVVTIPCLNASASGDNTGISSYIKDFPSQMTRVKISDHRKDSLLPDERKIGSDLLQLLKPELVPGGTTRDELIKQMQNNKQLKHGPSRNSSKDTLIAYVYIQLQPQTDVSVIHPYISEITDISLENNLVAAMIDVSRLVELASLCEVQSIQTIVPPVCSIGAVTSEGDIMHNADLVRTFGGIDGSGVKIGVISNGVDHIASSISSNDLPKNVTILSNNEGGDEGTAMLEIVHDLAPGAQLFFHDSGMNAIAFNNAIDELVSAGCNIICDDIYWIDQPFYQDGIIANHIRQVINNSGILYITSAGNYAQSHYQGQYRNYLGYHDFSNGAGKFKDLYMAIPPGGSITAVLQWNDLFDASRNDYDLYLVNMDTLTDLDTSENYQNGTQDPYELVYYKNYSASTIYAEIMVYNNGRATNNIELLLCGGNGTYIDPLNMVAKDSISGHAAAPEVITCGAINYSTPSKIEKYSSQGPVTLLTEKRQKPDICGADAVHITGAGGFGTTDKTFPGTSAAAPHVAAIMALIWQNHPELTATQVKARLLSNTVDLGAAGYDTVYGYGLADAYLSAFDFFNVEFMANGGDKDFTLTIPGNCYMKVPATTPTRAGYAFTGWYTEPECRTLWDFANNSVKANMKLYAGWKPGIYVISFDLQDGSTPLTILAEYNSKITQPSPTPSRQGFIFGGWYVDKACKTSWRFDTDLVPGNITLYAKMVPEVLPAPAGAQQIGSAYDGVTLGWQAVQYADGYEVSRSDTVDGTFTVVGTANTNSFTETGLTFNTPYYYKVRAFYNSTTTLYGEYSAVIAKPVPSAPILKANVASYKSVKLAWGAVAQATQYEIYRAASPSGSYQLLATTPACSYLNANVSPGTTYYYKARAYTLVSGVKVYGFYSSIVSAKATVAIPAGVSAARASSSSIKVAWGKVADATKYEVWRCTTSATGTFTMVGTASATNYTDKKLKAGSTYWYKVRAYRLEKGKKIYGDFTKVVSAKP